MYLIPKNIKVKKEIFKGFGILEIICVAISLGVGYLLSHLSNNFYVSITIFSVFPLLTFILLVPLPNGTNALLILKKFFLFTRRQKNYKFK